MPTTMMSNLSLDIAVTHPQIGERFRFYPNRAYPCASKSPSELLR